MADKIGRLPAGAGARAGRSRRRPRPSRRTILERLGFEVEPGEPWQVTAADRGGATSTARPTSSRRSPGSTAIDKVEATPLPRAPGVARPTATAEQLVERRVRRAAAARGLNEAVTWSFVAEEEAEPFGGSAWILANPISEEMKAMRPSLLPGLLAAARRNIARGADSVRLFEIGRRYLADGERPTLGLVLAGERDAAPLAERQGAGLRRL